MCPVQTSRGMLRERIFAAKGRIFGRISDDVRTELALSATAACHSCRVWWFHSVILTSRLWPLSCGFIHHMILTINSIDEFPCQVWAVLVFCCEIALFSVFSQLLADCCGLFSLCPLVVLMSLLKLLHSVICSLSIANKTKLRFCGLQHALFMGALSCSRHSSYHLGVKTQKPWIYIGLRRWPFDMSLQYLHWWSVLSVKLVSIGAF